MTYLACIFFAVAMPLLSPQAGNNSSYYQLSTEDFFKLPEVNAPVDTRNPDLQLLQAAVFFASNEARKDYRKNLFTHDQSLQEAARLQADYVKNLGRLDHRNRQRGKRKISERIEHFGGDFAAVAENLVRIHLLELGENNLYYHNDRGEPVDKHGQPLRKLSYAEAARKAVKNWLQSTGHRANLLGKYDHLGVGSSQIALSKDGIPQVYLAQNFGNKEL